MARVVMLTALAGEGIDIVAGDVCDCSPEQATRFLAFGCAREMTQGDESRRVKHLPWTAQPPAATGPEDPPPANPELPPPDNTAGDREPTQAPRKRRASRK